MTSQAINAPARNMYRKPDGPMASFCEPDEVLAQSAEERDGRAGIDGPDAIRRSNENVLAWLEYLPQDCIATMIRLGWDVST